MPERPIDEAVPTEVCGRRRLGFLDTLEVLTVLAASGHCDGSSFSRSTVDVGSFDVWSRFQLCSG